MNKLVLLTPTRNRAWAFNNLRHYMLRQSTGWDRWIVINDGAEPYTYHCNQEVIIRSPANDPPGLHSVCANYLAAVALAPDADRYLCIEDDDWYGNNYLCRMMALLDEAPLVGLAPARYYHTGNKAYMTHINRDWASLACTGFRAEVLPLFTEIARRGDPFIDMALFNEWRDGPRLMADSSGLHVGLKDGSGVGVGHYLSGPVDADGSVLRSWLGPDAERYRDVVAATNCS